MHARLKEKIGSRTATIGVIGLVSARATALFWLPRSSHFMTSDSASTALLVTSIKRFTSQCIRKIRKIILATFRMDSMQSIYTFPDVKDI